ncbi:MAG: nucleoside phosphorylase [Pelolinea sp.]|nr:nucleoside phosphorylase [Pelolinea sp.]
MEWHIKCDPKEIARYVFTPGDQARAEKIAKNFDSYHLVTQSRGYTVYSGEYKGVPMTACGMGMGGPTLAIGMQELANMGADTFIRVGSCGVFQKDQKTGDVIIATGTVREGGTGNAYLPINFPAVATFSVLRALVEASEELDLPTTVGVGIAGDSFYGPRDSMKRELMVKAGLVSAEMESDTLFIVGAYNGWRTGSILASDGDPGVIKPEDKEKIFRQGEQNSIKIAIHAVWKLAEQDKK